MSPTRAVLLGLILAFAAACALGAISTASSASSSASSASRPGDAALGAGMTLPGSDRPIAGPVRDAPENTADSVSSDIAWLYENVRARQWNKSVASFFPFTFGHEVGKFQTDVHFNFVGGPVEQALRGFGVPDDNMFVTSFVLESIFEALELAPDAVEADQWSVAAAVNATLGLRDKNTPHGTPIFGFWPQRYMPAMDASLPWKWQQWPINVAGWPQQGVDDAGIFKDIVCAVLGCAVWDKFGPPFVNFLHGLTVMLQIPSDADDSSVVIALDRHVQHHATQFPEAHSLWESAAFNYSTAFEHYDKYSYCIASNESDKNTIDPRTYFWAHDYLNNLTDADACIITTWMQNSSTMQKIVTNQTNGPAMPINVNNLDPTVGANSLYAISTVLLKTNDTGFFESNARMRKLYLQTADFVSYALRTQPEQRRPDLELLYYPPEYNIVWFVARHLNMLRSHTDGFKFPEVAQVESMLTDAFAEGALTFLWNAAKLGSTCGTTDTYVACWDGFLGQGDTDAAGKPTPHYEDRFSNTATAALGLLDGYTVRVQNTTSGSWTLQWTDDAPTLAKSLVNMSVNYLRGAMRQNDTSYANAFFSGSGKYWEQYQFWYPANIKDNWKTGLPVNCSQPNPEVLRDIVYYSLFGARGKIDHDEFEKLAKEGCMFISAPTWFSGYNGKIGVKPGPLGLKTAWPFWSSPVLSYALGMQALAKYRALMSSSSV